MPRGRNLHPPRERPSRASPGHRRAPRSTSRPGTRHTGPRRIARCLRAAGRARSKQVRHRSGTVRQSSVRRGWRPGPTRSRPAMRNGADSFASAASCSGVRSDRSRGRTRHSLRRQQRAATRLRSAMTTAPAPDAGDIPMAATSFVGREREVDRIRSLLAESRLLTLTGPGGIGKTRLAIEAARQSARRCTGGLFVVELASIRDPNQVLPQRCGECPAGRDSDPPGYRHQPHSAASRWRAGVRGRATRAADARAARSQPSPDRIGGALPRAPTGASDT